MNYPSFPIVNRQEELARFLNLAGPGASDPHERSNWNPTTGNAQSKDHPQLKTNLGDYKMERTLVLLKPDCIQRRLAGRVIARFEDKGFNIVALKLLRVTPELAKRHYAEHVEKAFYPGLETYITAAPTVAMVVEGPRAIDVVRQMAGPTNGLDAPAGTIRGDLGASKQMNLVHASDGTEAAKREIEIFFTSEEICAYEPAISPWLQAPDGS